MDATQALGLEKQVSPTAQSSESTSDCFLKQWEQKL